MTATGMRFLPNENVLKLGGDGLYNFVNIHQVTNSNTLRVNFMVCLYLNKTVIKGLFPLVVRRPRLCTPNAGSLGLIQELDPKCCNSEFTCHI